VKRIDEQERELSEKIVPALVVKYSVLAERMIFA
jgi:hypothetical protein